MAIQHTINGNGQGRQGGRVQQGGSVTKNENHRKLITITLDDDKRSSTSSPTANTSLGTKSHEGVEGGRVSEVVAPLSQDNVMRWFTAATLIMPDLSTHC